MVKEKSYVGKDLWWEKWIDLYVGRDYYIPDLVVKKMWLLVAGECHGNKQPEESCRKNTKFGSKTSEKRTSVIKKLHKKQITIAKDSESKCRDIWNSGWCWHAVKNKNSVFIKILRPYPSKLITGLGRRGFLSGSFVYEYE